MSKIENKISEKEQKETIESAGNAIEFSLYNIERKVFEYNDRVDFLEFKKAKGLKVIDAKFKYEASEDYPAYISKSMDENLIFEKRLLIMEIKQELKKLNQYIDVYNKYAPIKMNTYQLTDFVSD